MRGVCAESQRHSHAGFGPALRPPPPTSARPYAAPARLALPSPRLGPGLHLHAPIRGAQGHTDSRRQQTLHVHHLGYRHALSHVHEAQHGQGVAMLRRVTVWQGTALPVRAEGRTQYTINAVVHTQILGSHNSLTPMGQLEYSHVRSPLLRGGTLRTRR